MKSAMFSTPRTHESSTSATSATSAPGARDARPSLTRAAALTGALLAALGATGCALEPQELASTGDPSAAEAAATEGPGTSTTAAAATVAVCREVQHFGYSYAGQTYTWDVTSEFGSGRQFVDERRPGTSFYRQYRVSPVWSTCPHANERVTLTHPAITLTGWHNCLPDGRQEFHGSDYQRVLVPRPPYLSYNCDP